MKKRETFRHLRHRFTEVVEFQPFEIGTSFALVFFGIRALVTGLSSAPGSIQVLPLWLALSYCILSVFGGLSVVFGMFAAKRFSWAYGFELLGLFISTAAWATYIIGLLMSPITGKSTLLILALTALTIAPLLRASRVKKNARAELIALRYVNREGGHA